MSIKRFRIMKEPTGHPRYYIEEYVPTSPLLLPLTGGWNYVPLSHCYTFFGTVWKLWRYVHKLHMSESTVVKEYEYEV